MAAVFDRSGSGGHRAVMASASPMASAPVTGSATASASAAPVAASASASSSASSGSSGSSEAAKDADGIDAALRGKSSKEKLDSLMGGFDTFQHVMREGTRVRILGVMLGYMGLVRFCDFTRRLLRVGSNAARRMSIG